MSNTPPSKKQIGGGSLLIAWQLTGKSVLIVGGGEVAAQRIDSILTTDAHITLLAPTGGLYSRTAQLLSTHPDRITHRPRLYEGPQELDDIDMVLTALDDPELSRDIATMARTAHIPVNAADIPELCDFYFGAQLRDGPLQIMISTNGNGPRLASLIRGRVQKSLSGLEGAAIERVGELRSLLKERAPGVGGPLGRRRMKWMTELCNSWPMEDMAQMTEPIMRRLLDEGWEKDRVPMVEEIGGIRHTKAELLHNQTSQLLPSAVGFAFGVACTTLAYIYKHRR